MSGVDSTALINHLIDTSAAVNENVKEIHLELRGRAAEIAELRTDVATLGVKVERLAEISAEDLVTRVTLLEQSRKKWDDAAEAIVRISTLEIYAKIAVWLVGIALTGAAGVVTAWVQGWIK